MINLIYPRLCLHCEATVDKGSRLFCRGCSSFFELIDPRTRCIYCFNETEGRSPCAECIRKKSWGLNIASALDYLGAVATLVKQLKHGRMPYLAKTASAFMLTQLTHLNWPTPDIVVPVPGRHLFQGTNHAHLIAEHLAERLSIPCHSLVKRRLGDLSQARLSKAHREALPIHSFFLKKPCSLDGQTILLVDDVVTTGTTLQRTAHALQPAFPAHVYALTLARTAK